MKIIVDEENQYWEFDEEDTSMLDLKEMVNDEISKEDPDFDFLDVVETKVLKEIEKQIGEKVEMRCWDGYDVIGEYDLK